MSKAVHTKKPEIAWAAVVIRNIGCSTAVGLPFSGIQDKLGAAAGVLSGEPNLGADMAPVTTIIMSFCSHLVVVDPSSPKGNKQQQKIQQKRDKG